MNTSIALTTLALVAVLTTYSEQSYDSTIEDQAVGVLNDYDDQVSANHSTINASAADAFSNSRQSTRLAASAFKESGINKHLLEPGL